MDAGAGYSVTDDNTQPGLNSVVNESQTLADTVTTFLNNPNVVLSSVVVTNLSGAITYLLNVDYILIPHGILTEIQRLPTGAIPNATTVLVSYQFQSDLPIKYGTTDLHGRVTLDLFNHLTLYVNRQSTENTVLSGTNMGQLQNLEETLFGTIVRWAPATVTAEHEIYDSSLAPYISDMVSLDVAEPIGDTQRVGGNATYRHVTFTGDGALTLRTAGADVPGDAQRLAFVQRDGRIRVEQRPGDRQRIPVRAAWRWNTTSAGRHCRWSIRSTTRMPRPRRSFRNMPFSRSAGGCSEHSRANDCAGAARDCAARPGLRQWTGGNGEKC